MASPGYLSSLILFGAYADLPAAGVPGRIYLASDGTIPISRDNGTSWDAPTASSISEEEVQDIVGAMIVAGDNVSVDYDDPSGTVTISVTIPSLSSEAVQDIVGAMVVNGGGVTATYSDGGNTLTFGFNYGSGSQFETGVQSVVVSFFSNRLLKSGGGTNDFLVKNSGTNYDVDWKPIPDDWLVPVGGTTGQVLKKTSDDDRDVEWADESAGAGDPALGDITDVTLTSPTTGDVLIKGMGDWVNLPLEDAVDAITGPIPSALNDLSDVGGTPSTGQVLRFNGTSWAPATPSAGGGDGNPFTLMYTENGNVIPLENGLLMTREVV